ncbi:MAG: sulfur carrier protein ThiS [Muribaculaceae bacterium]|nr:sulfur carrier protein ThiS [Muribaculaceae bacterium]
MEIKVNSESRDIMPGTTVADLAAQLGIDGRGVAIAINDHVVTRSLWPATIIEAGTSVTVIRAAYGG